MTVVPRATASGRAASALEAIAFGSVAITARALQSAGEDLTIAQWRVIVIVGDSPEGASVSEVAERLGSELSPTSRLIRRAARRGLVTIAKSDHDRRVTRIRLTERGQAIRDGVLARRRADLLTVLEAAGAVDPAGASLLARLGEAFRPFV